ncbi:MAG: YeeE/YedE family protein [Fidelibacterota bacterium]|nr:MAG: YeeE/YedE family protein [Candidatus Neomarinimicrobiota bacterium]
MDARHENRSGKRNVGRPQGKPAPYCNPYLAGIGLGLTLLAAFLLMGRGLGASGAFTSLVSAGVDAVAPDHAATNGMYSVYLDNDGRNPLSDWLVFEIIGVFLGAFISAYLAGRIKGGIVKGSRISSRGRLLMAFLGGAMMGFAAKLARGCTSGLALSGGAVMGVGAWIFMLSIFIGGYAAAYFVRRQWT